MLLVAGASKEAPLLVDTDGSSDSPEEAQPYVYPPHLDACRTHGDEFDVDSVVAETGAHLRCATPVDGEPPDPAARSAPDPYSRTKHPREFIYTPSNRGPWSTPCAFDAIIIGKQLIFYVVARKGGNAGWGTSPVAGG